MRFDFPARFRLLPSRQRPGARRAFCGCFYVQTVALACGLLTGPGCGPATPTAGAASAGARTATKGAAASSTTAAASTAAPSVTSSLFATGPDSGQDPFFPGISSEHANNGSAKVVPRAALSTYLKLAGIRPGKLRPLALINQTTFAPGEEGTVSIVVSNPPQPLAVQRINIRCLEIRPDSVLVHVAGEPGVTELHFAQKD